MTWRSSHAYSWLTSFCLVSSCCIRARDHGLNWNKPTPYPTFIRYWGKIRYQLMLMLSKKNNWHFDIKYVKTYFGFIILNFSQYIIAFIIYIRFIPIFSCIYSKRKNSSILPILSAFIKKKHSSISAYSHNLISVISRSVK